VLQTLAFDTMGIPYWLTVSMTIGLIWLYTFRSGIKTVVWTDTLQTFFMLLALVVTVVVVYDQMNITEGLASYIANSPLSKTFFFEDLNSSDYFWKQFLSGAFIAIVMTGLDQDMMQKNLSC